MSFDVIRAVEACYAGVGEDGVWLGGLLDTLKPLDGGPGFYGELYDMDERGVPRVECSAVSGALPPPILDTIHALYASMPPEALRTLFAPRPAVEYILRRAGRVGPAIEAIGRKHLGRCHVDDTLWIVATEPDGRVALLAMAIAQGGPRLPPRTLHQLGRLSAHLSSAVRLRRRVSEAPGGEPAKAADAILDPAGRLLHANGRAQLPEARRSLADAVRRMDRARGALRREDPEEALELWQGLVDGTWSLVDSCDADGKRYLLARRNEPGVRDPKALTSRERSVLAFAAMGHQNKYIGYLLGISPSAVAAHLASVLRKLGLSSRAELIGRFAALARAAPPPGSRAAPGRTSAA
jgi:DNA-binding CsgD family transcriptional regulator